MFPKPKHFLTSRASVREMDFERLSPRLFWSLRHSKTRRSAFLSFRLKSSEANEMEKTSILFTRFFWCLRRSKAQKRHVSKAKTFLDFESLSQRNGLRAPQSATFLEFEALENKTISVFVISTEEQRSKRNG
jgi:hypothetical protein